MLKHRSRRLLFGRLGFKEVENRSILIGAVFRSSIKTEPIAFLVHQSHLVANARKAALSRDLLYIKLTSWHLAGERLLFLTSLNVFFPVGWIFHFEKDLNIANVDMLQCPTRLEHAQQTSGKCSLCRASHVYHCVQRGRQIVDHPVSNFIGLTSWPRLTRLTRIFRIGWSFESINS